MDTVALVGGGRSLYDAAWRYLASSNLVPPPPRPRLKLWAPHALPLEKSYLPELLNISPTTLGTDQSSKQLTAEMKVQQEPSKDQLKCLRTT